MKVLVFTTLVHLYALLVVLLAGLFFDWTDGSMMPVMAVTPIGVSVLSILCGRTALIKGALRLGFPYFSLCVITIWVSIQARSVIMEKGPVPFGLILNAGLSLFFLVGGLLLLAFLLSKIMEEQICMRWAIIPPTVFSLSLGVTVYDLSLPWNWMPLACGIALLSIFFKCLGFISYAKPDAGSSS